VFADTHIREATLSAPLEQLTATDWVPFQSKEARPDWVMVGHMRVAALDPARPASASPAVVARLRELGHTGVVVTDDFSMGAIWRSKLGIGGAAVEALNAGVDLLLVSYDSDQIYRVLHALLEADRTGRLDRKRLEESDARLERARLMKAAM
jgi:beta-N-acetylhexosaminidase